MFAYIVENLATIIGSLIVLAILTLIIVNGIRGKKNNKSSCGCGCAGCPSSGVCHPRK